jgi:hypothetical protein
MGIRFNQIAYISVKPVYKPAKCSNKTKYLGSNLAKKGSQGKPHEPSESFQKIFEKQLNKWE